MNAYKAEYYKSYGYGAFDEYKYVIFAEDENVALGLALEAEESTVAKHWDIEKLDSDERGVYLIYEHM